VAYRMVVASLMLCFLLVVGLLLLERTGFIEIDEREIQPEVVSCQIGHKDMEVRVQGLLPRGGCPAVRVVAPPVRRVRRVLLGQTQGRLGAKATRRDAMRRRPRRRRRKGRRSRRGARPEKFIDVRVERSPNSRGRPAKVKIVRRRNGDVSEETFEL
jgi:hypothetical protein